MPDVGKERSYWLKGDMFSKGGASDTAAAEAVPASSTGFKFGFGGGQTAGSAGAAFSMLQKHGKPTEDN